MDRLNSKVIGACAIGVALVGGAYLLQNFGESQRSGQPAEAYRVIEEPSPRSAIAVSDSDNDGIEDWQEELLSVEPIRRGATSSTYTPPDTMTGQIGVELFQNFLLNNSSGPLARDPENLASLITEDAVSRAQIELYERSDLTIVPASDTNIRAYGNGLARALRAHSITVQEHELLLLRKVIEVGDPEAEATLARLASTTQGYHDDTLKLAVPDTFVKPHLDLLNTYNAVRQNFVAFTEPDRDPVKTFIHARRHLDDTRAVGIALLNMYEALARHASAFERGDPAMLFAELANGQPSGSGS